MLAPNRDVNLKLVHDSGRHWSTPVIEPERKITGPFHRLEALGFLPYALPGGNPGTGKLSPHTSIKPCNFGKVPAELNKLGLYHGMREWTKRGPTTREEANAWEERNENQLIRTGKIATFPDDAPALIAIDCDAETAEMSEAFLAIVETKFGRLSLRRRPGKPHRWLAIVRGIKGAGDQKSIRVAYTDSEGREARVELLIRGGQFVAGGVNANGSAWEWPDGTPALSELPMMTADDILDLESEFEAAVIAHGGKLSKDHKRQRERQKRESKPREDCNATEWVNQEALRRLDAWVPEVFPAARRSGEAYRVSARDLGRSCEEDLSFHQDGIRDFGAEQSHDPIGVIQQFFTLDEVGELAPADFGNDYVPVGDVPRERATVELCRLLNIDWEAECARDWDQMQAGFDDDFIAAYAKECAARSQAGAIAATPFRLRDPASIEPRRWLYGRHYIRDYLSATVAPGGLGKSSLVLAEAIAMASGKNLLGELPAEKLRVWYWNGEDPRDEIERRATATCMRHGIAAGDIDGCLFINSGRETEIVIARADRNGVKVAEPVIEALRRTIRANKIDLLVIDPFVASHAVPENDNGAINAVCRQWAMLADAAGCAVELVHHVRKGAVGQGEYTVDDARGAGALLAAARSVRVLNRMTTDEASRAGVRNPRLFFRVDNGKANLAPPAESSTWREIVSVSLGNDRGTIRGDSIGVVMPWTWPDHSGALTPDDVRAIQEAIAGGEWRASAQAKTWAGHAVGEVLDLDLSEPEAKASAKAILKSLIEDGFLKSVDRRDDTRKLRAFIMVGKKVNELRKTQLDGLKDNESLESEVSHW
jgi:AAA domain